MWWFSKTTIFTQGSAMRPATGYLLVKSFLGTFWSQVIKLPLAQNYNMRHLVTHETQSAECSLKFNPLTTRDLGPRSQGKGVHSSRFFSIELFSIGNRYVYSLIIEPFSIENFTHYIIWVKIHIICKEIRPDILEQCTRVDLIQGRLKWMGTKRPNTINIAHSIRSKYTVK